VLYWNEEKNRGIDAMNEQSDHQECLETTARVLIRCFLGGAIFLLIWFIAYVVARDWMYLMQTRWFSITREHFALVQYCGMAATKLFIIVAFLIPYACLRLVLRKKP
jgi:hypothetical protein